MLIIIGTGCHVTPAGPARAVVGEGIPSETWDVCYKCTYTRVSFARLVWGGLTLVRQDGEKKRYIYLMGCLVDCCGFLIVCWTCVCLVRMLSRLLSAALAFLLLGFALLAHRY